MLGVRVFGEVGVVARPCWLGLYMSSIDGILVLINKGR